MTNVRLNASTGPDDEVEEARDVRRQIAVEQAQVEPERMDHVADVERDDVPVRDLVGPCANRATCSSARRRPRRRSACARATSPATRRAGSRSRTPRLRRYRDRDRASGRRSVRCPRWQGDVAAQRRFPCHQMAGYWAGERSAAGARPGAPAATPVVPNRTNSHSRRTRRSAVPRPARPARCRGTAASRASRRRSAGCTSATSRCRS